MLQAIYLVERFYCDFCKKGGDTMEGIEFLTEDLFVCSFCEGSTGGGSGPEPPPGGPCDSCMCQGEG